MKVLDLCGIGDIRLKERSVPDPGEGEVLLEVRACGICSSDEDRIFKTGTYHFPTVPGHEFAGKVVSVGKGVDEAIIGAKASVFPLLPCFECESCRRKQYATCSDYRYFGSRNDGGFSEYIVIPEWNLNILDDSIPYEIGALSEPAAVANHAVTVAEIDSGDTVVIIGTGAIGVLIAGICKTLGASPIVVGRRAESVEMVRSFGLRSMLAEEIHREAKICNIQAVFEAVGTNEAMTQAIELVEPNGTIVAVGNPKGDLELDKKVYWKILRKQITLKGTWNSAYRGDTDDWKAVSALMRDKAFPFEKLITATYSLDEFENAFQHLRDKSKPKSRIVFVMKGEDNSDEG